MATKSVYPNWRPTCPPARGAHCRRSVITNTRSRTDQHHPDCYGERLKTSLGEMESEHGEDVEAVELPKKIEHIVEEIRRNIECTPRDAAGD